MRMIEVGALMLAISATATGQQASGESSHERQIVKQIDVDAPRAFVWSLWSTSAGAEEFGPGKADVELKLDGRFEWYFKPDAPEGQRGSEGCRVLSFMPPEMLAFSWNAPPSIAELRNAGAKTQVVIRLDEPSPGKTHVVLTQHGFGQGEAWDKYVQYFERAWPNVLKSLPEYCTSPEGRKDAAEYKASAAPQPKTWSDKHVSVSAISGADKRQEFTMTVPAAIGEVWSALATTDGFRKHTGASQAEIELKPGGRYAVWPGATNRVLAFIPDRMLSVSGSAPPEFPNVRKGGTWSAYWLEADGPRSTKLRLTVIGWRDGEKEWDEAFEYFLKNNPVFLNALYDSLAATAKTASPDSVSGSMLRHEGLVDAPVEQVWAAFTTKAGLESWMVAQANIDLRIGGKMLTKYRNEGTLDDDETIENTILSFEPNRMISVKATRPPRSFPLKEAIEKMWTVVYFDPAERGKTKVTCVGMGFQGDEESQKLRQHFDMGNAWTIKKLQQHFAKPAAESAAASK